MSLSNILCLCRVCRGFVLPVGALYNLLGLPPEARSAGGSRDSQGLHQVAQTAEETIDNGQSTAHRIMDNE